jgi:hypothetical protein
MYGWDAGSGVRERYSETYAFAERIPQVRTGGRMEAGVAVR